MRAVEGLVPGDDRGVDARLVLAGDGELRPVIESRIAAAGLVAFALYDSVALGGVMALAMLLNLLLAATMGVAIPYVRARLGRDPAVGSSVLITACTDSSSGIGAMCNCIGSESSILSPLRHVRRSER